MMLRGDLRYLRLNVIDSLRFSLFIRPILIDLERNFLIIFQPYVLLHVSQLWRSDNFSMFWGNISVIINVLTSTRNL